MIKSTIFTTLLAMGIMGIYGCSHLNGPNKPHGSTSPCFKFTHKVNTNYHRITDFHKPPNTIVDRSRYAQDYDVYRCSYRASDDPLQKLIKRKKR